MFKIPLVFFIASLSLSHVHAYPEYVEIPDKPDRTECGYSILMDPFIQDEISVIFEIGSRDCTDALALTEHYKCHVFSFECNPDALALCRANIRSNPNITLVEKAAWHTTTTISFFPVPKHNIGASSCFRFDRNDHVHHHWLEQTEINVQAIRLDEFLSAHHIDHIDLLCMDVQGAAFEVFQGLGEFLQTIKYIVVELEIVSLYQNEVLASDVDRYLNERGFVKVFEAGHPEFKDFCYINTNLVTRS